MLLYRVIGKIINRMAISSAIESCLLRNVLDKTLNVLGEEGKRNLFYELEGYGIVLDGEAYCSSEKIKVVFREVIGNELAKMLLDRIALQLHSR